MMRNSARIILTIALIICVIGIFCIFSSTHQKEGRLWQDIYKKQIIWAVFGLIAFLYVANFFDYRRLWDWAYPLYISAIFLLGTVFVLGIIRLGAQRWLTFSWFNFQPSEFAKLAVIVFMARYFSRKSTDYVSLSAGRYGILKGIALPFLLTLIPAGLIIEQPDLGSGAMIIILFIALLYLTAVRLKYILTFILFMVLPLPFFWHFLRDYQKQRLLVFINPNVDPLGAGYTVIQSKIAIGSGTLWGKGWLGGTQSALHFLPEAHTDFIFATFAEQWGLLGSIFLLVMYALLIRQGMIIAQRTQDSFGRLLAFGISLMLGIQVLINVSMNAGLFPVVGLPLQLMSYGGSSLLITFILLGILASIDKRRSVF